MIKTRWTIPLAAVLCAAQAPAQTKVAVDPQTDLKIQVEKLRVDVKEKAFEAAKLAWVAPMMEFQAQTLTFGEVKGDHAYAMGQRALDQRQWDQALTFFEKVEKGSSRADAALYWSAYAQNKLGKRDQALAALEVLKRDFASSRWLNDARALEVEVRQASGRSVSPENATDDEMKLLALQGIMHNDAEKALPILEKMLAGPQSPKVKERALFVLGQSELPKAQEKILQIAKGGGNPDLQRTAIRMVGMRSRKDNQNQKLLAELYQSQSDVAMKREVLRAFVMAGAKEQLLTIAKTERDSALRKDAIRQVGVTGQAPALVELYKGEQDAAMRGEIANALGMSGNAQPLIELAGSEKDASTRGQIYRSLGMMGKEKSGSALTQMYGRETDKGNKTQLLRAFAMQNNPQALIEAARGEKDAELKREAVRSLSMMKSKEASDFLVELLNK